MRVLVVEDIEINRVVIQMILEQLECEVEWAEDGFLGVQKFDSGQFDLVFMDLQMPNCDGFEATRLIRKIEALENRPILPIYALSANTSEADQAMSFDSGMNGFLAKPVTVSIIRQVLTNVKPAWIDISI
jgi:CheY-like chemotaxis protein